MIIAVNFPILSAYEVKYFWRFSVACYVYFSKLPTASNVRERKTRLFVAQSELSREKQWVRRLETSLQVMT